MDPLWIGLDVGGSGGRALSAARLGGRWSVSSAPLEFLWDDDFRPVPLREQLAYPGELTAQEEVCGSRRVRLLADCVLELAAERAFKLGVCVPGLQTSDGRGVEAWRNGPRRLTFLRDLERSISASGGEIIDVPSSLCPDSIACALGELRSEQGVLYESANALCISGGSGVGEAVIVEGSCHTLDELDPPLPRAWELSGGGGQSLEDRVAPGLLMAAWQGAGRAGAPEEHDGEDAALLLDTQDAGLSSLIERARGWFSARGLELERVGLCQALGRIYASAPQRLDLIRDRFASIEILTSDFRGAPALGAVIAAEERAS